MHRHFRAKFPPCSVAPIASTHLPHAGPVLWSRCTCALAMTTPRLIAPRDRPTRWKICAAPDTTKLLSLPFHRGLNSKAQSISSHPALRLGHGCHSSLHVHWQAAIMAVWMRILIFINALCRNGRLTPPKEPTTCPFREASYATQVTDNKGKSVSERCWVDNGFKCYTRNGWPCYVHKTPGRREEEGI